MRNIVGEPTERAAESRRSPAGRFVRKAGSPVAVLRGRTRLLDLLVLSAVPVALLVVFALPVAQRRALALDYGAPTLLAAYANHFVHLSTTHLLANLVGYVVVVSAAYLLSVASGRRRQFLVVFAGFVLGLPFALSGLNFAFARSSLAVGFSGINMALVGYLAFALGDYIGAWLDLPVDRRRSRWLFFLGLALVALLSAPTAFGVPLAVAAALSAILCLVPVLEDLREAPRSGASAAGRAGTLEIGGLGLAVFGIFPFAAFPGNASVAAGTVNLYSHLLGFCLGYVATYVTLLAGGLEVD